MSTGPYGLIAAVVAASVATTTALRADTPLRLSVPMVCSRGPSGQLFGAIVTLPAAVTEGSTYAIRIDGVPSGPVSHAGLNYIHDMSTDYVVPAGATYVAGSARIIPGTGTANVASGARVWHERGLIRVALPGRVASGSSYTPPSVEVQLAVSAPAGASLPLAFLVYHVTANAFLVGDVHTTCDPTPKPYTLGVTRVTAAP